MQDYYASVKVETLIYFQAKDEKHAANVADKIAGNLQVDISRCAPKKYRTTTDVDTDGYEIAYVSPHE